MERARISRTRIEEREEQKRKKKKEENRQRSNPVTGGKFNRRIILSAAVRGFPNRVIYAWSRPRR